MTNNVNIAELRALIAKATEQADGRKCCRLQGDDNALVRAAINALPALLTIAERAPDAKRAFDHEAAWTYFAAHGIFPRSQTDADLKRALQWTIEEFCLRKPASRAPDDLGPAIARIAADTFPAAPDAGVESWIETAQRGFEKWRLKEHNAKWFRKIDGTPIPNDLPIVIGQEFADAITALIAKRDRAQEEAACWHDRLLASCESLAAKTEEAEGLREVMHEKSAPSAPTVPWFPISGAPRSTVVLVSDGAHSCAAILNDRHPNDWLISDGEAAIFDQAGDCYIFVWPRPTHWSPLPAPPTITEPAAARAALIPVRNTNISEPQ